MIFTVTEGNGRMVPGLNKEDFLVEEDGRKQEVSHFAREVTLPLTLALLIDTSPSVQPVLDLEKQTAIEFLHSVLRKEDLALVMNFDRGVSLVQDFTADIRRLSKAIQSVAIGGGTSVHDAVFLACDEKLKRETGRKAIILISDGGDTTSKLKIKDAIESAQRADVIIYAISNSSGGPFFGGAETMERSSGMPKPRAEGRFSPPSLRISKRLSMRFRKSCEASTYSATARRTR